MIPDAARLVLAQIEMYEKVSALAVDLQALVADVRRYYATEAVKVAQTQPRYADDVLLEDTDMWESSARRAYNAMRPDINTIGELRQKTAWELLRRKSFGKVALLHLRRWLAHNNMALDGESVQGCP